MSDQIWIQTVRHSDGILEIIFLKKVDFEKKKISRQQKKHEKLPSTLVVHTYVVGT